MAKHLTEEQRKEIPESYRRYRQELWTHSEAMDLLIKNTGKTPARIRQILQNAGISPQEEQQKEKLATMQKALDALPDILERAQNNCSKPLDAVSTNQGKYDFKAYADTLSNDIDGDDFLDLKPLPDKKPCIVPGKVRFTPEISADYEIAAKPNFITGESVLYDANGNIKQKWVKSNTRQIHTHNLVKEIINVYRDAMPKEKPNKDLPKIKEADLLVSYPMGDPHFGMLAYPEVYKNFTNENREPHWNLELAAKYHNAAISELAKATPDTKECLLVNLGDYFHFDNSKHLTTHGANRLDVSGDTSQILYVGLQSFRRQVQRLLEKHKIVNIIWQTGNHDEHTALVVQTCLGIIYEDEPRVRIIKSPLVRHYFRWEGVLIGTTHGDMRGCKIKDLPLKMAAERPQDWGETTFRHFYVGHLHHQEIDEESGAGCYIEIFPTLAPKDEWHAKRGYKSAQNMKGIVYHKKYGIDTRVTKSIQMLEDLCK